jgi:hypothetical protein
MNEERILDPVRRDMPGLLYATEILFKKDDFCLELINAYSAELFSLKNYKRKGRH